MAEGAFLYLSYEDWCSEYAEIAAASAANITRAAITLLLFSFPEKNARIAHTPARARQTSLPPGEIMAVPGTKRNKAAITQVLKDEELILMLRSFFSGRSQPAPLFVCTPAGIRPALQTALGRRSRPSKMICRNCFPGRKTSFQSEPCTGPVRPAARSAGRHMPLTFSLQ